MTNDTEAVVRRWIMAFCEAPILVEPELMRRVLDTLDQQERPMTDKTFKAGDAVEWDHSQGTTQGKVVKKVTRPTHIKDHDVAASKDHPEYIVKSDKTGAKAAHKPDALRRA